MSYLKEERKVLSSLLLDCTLKSETIPKIQYDIKMIECGEYKQFYVYDVSYSRQVSGWESPITYKDMIEQKEQLMLNIEDSLYDKKTKLVDKPTLKQIELRNIIRSNNSMCRIVRTNEKIFSNGCFVTLTFADDITDIDKANYEFHKFLVKIKRVYHSLSYVAVPEFQKNNRVHYHLLTNISYNDITLINENISLLQLYHKLNNYKTLFYKSYTKGVVKGDISPLIRKLKESPKSCLTVGIKDFTAHMILQSQYFDLSKYNHLAFSNENADKFYISNGVHLYNSIPHVSSTFVVSSLNEFDICFRYQNGILHNTKKTYNSKNQQLKIFKTIKYWNNGFSNVISIKGNISDITRYMAKYMIKDNDDRLYGKKRYFFSQNLQKPKITYLNQNIAEDSWLLDTLLNTENVIYQNSYKSQFGDSISFFEIKDKDID